MRERGLNGMQLTVYSKGGQGDRRYPQLRLLCTKEEATKAIQSQRKGKAQHMTKCDSTTSYPPNVHDSSSFSRLKINSDDNIIYSPFPHRWMGWGSYKVSGFDYKTQKIK